VAVEAPPAFLGGIEKLVGQRQREGLGELSCKPGTRLELVTPSLPLAVVGRRYISLHIVVVHGPLGAGVFLERDVDLLSKGLSGPVLDAVADRLVETRSAPCAFLLGQAAVLVLATAAA
jgi:hypothetical protein